MIVHPADQRRNSYPRQMPDDDLGNNAQQTYDLHAPSYDLFLRDYKYERWTGKLLDLAEQTGLSGKRLLDVGCGTGLSLIVPIERGYTVSGCDISPAMIWRAEERLRQGAKLSVADMRQLPKLGPFDLVWAINDAINYLLSWQELIMALTGLRANLDTDGLLLFDLNTLHSYKTFFCETHTVEEGGRVMTWEGMMQPWQVHPTTICQARYSVSGKEEVTAIHRQRHVPESEVLAALQICGLECIAVHGELDGELSQPLDEDRHSKAVYLARAA